MSLLDKLNMIKVYCKNIKKSIHHADRISLSLVLALLVLITSPFIINLLFRISMEKKQINLYISSSFEDFFGQVITEKLLWEFDAQNPDLRIRLITNEKDIEPDIIIFDEGDHSFLAAAGLLAELNFYTNYEAGIQFAIPLVSFIDLLFYNIELLSSAGFDRPPKTREEYLAYARTISTRYNDRTINTAGAVMSLLPEDRLALSRDVFSWIWAAGNDFWQGENTPVLNTRAIIDDISFLGSLYRENALAPNVFDITGAQRLEDFARGRIAMMIASTRAIPFLRERLGDDVFGITTIPGTNTPGKYGVSLSGIYAGISVSCKYPDEAWSFLVFLDRQRSLFCEELKAVPGVVSNIIPGDYVRDDPFYSKAWDIFESSAIVRGFSGIQGAGEYKSVFLEELRIFFETGRTAQDTVTFIQQRWNSVNRTRQDAAE